MQVYILKESNSDSRVAASPDTVKKMKDWGLNVVIQDNAGLKSNFSNEEYIKSGAIISNEITDISKSDLILKINKPSDDEIALMNEGSVLIASLDPYNNSDTLNKLKDKGVTSFAMELMPRITRAQSMDILSSQSNLAGYKAVIDATYLFNKAMPMMMTAAGTISPSKVFVVGVGVAGLQAIATAKRLGAKVEAFDTRPVVEEQVKSLGARFVKIDIGETEETAQGYAKELSAEQINLQRAGMKKVCSSSDVIITTAQVFGRKAPVIITSDMIEDMQPGSVIVDMAVGTGGNVEGSIPDENLELNGITIVGNTNLPGEVAIHASQVYSANIFNLIDEFWDQKNSILEITTSDEILSGCLVTHKGEFVNSMVKERYS